LVALFLRFVLLHPTPEKGLHLLISLDLFLDKDLMLLAFSCLRSLSHLVHHIHYSLMLSQQLIVVTINRIEFFHRTLEEAPLT